MNDMALWSREQDRDLDERAERIRSLVGVARGCIVEVGRELIEAKAQCAHGRWLPWLEQEFGWSEPTAKNYMGVARAFKSLTVSDFTDLTIDATALYALAGPGVPQSVRDEAIDRAEAGERITKAQAERMVAAAQASAEDRLRAALEEQRQAASHGIARAMELANQQYAKDTGMLQAEIERIKVEQTEPDIPQAIEMFCKILGKPKLTASQLQLLAQILGTPITDGRRTYPPVSEIDARQAEENMRIASAADRAIEYFAGAPDPQTVREAAIPSQRAKADRLVAAALDWLKSYAQLA